MGIVYILLLCIHNNAKSIQSVFQDRNYCESYLFTGNFNILQKSIKQKNPKYLYLI